MKQKLMILVLALSPLLAQGARIAVTDSGADFAHEWLKGRALINEKEIANNRVDDDRNGKVDDVMGWNFVDDYGRVFFPNHLQEVDTNIFKFFEVIARLQDGTATSMDKVFWWSNVKLMDKASRKAISNKLNFYGQYAHGTHCSGVIASLSPNSKIMTNRVFPDTLPDSEPPSLPTQPTPPKKSPVATPETEDKSGKGITIPTFVYKFIAAVNNRVFEKVSVYLNEQKIDVANYSLGVPLQTIARMALGLKKIEKPTPAQLSEETKRVAEQFEPIGKKWIGSAPNTLFVIAAGNDGSDNDAIPTFPSNVRMPNAITVAASHGNTKLAKFSNYGLTTVDIAAPGVSIVSAVPSLNKKQLLPMSGTSMAAPYVTGIAAKLKEMNPNLTPADLKAILMGTVDHKEWLKTKVVSAGVINPSRAIDAAEKSKSMNVAEAVQAARVSVADAPETKTVMETKNFSFDDLEMKAFADQFVF